MPQITFTINLTDAELEAFNFLAAAYDETQTESAESYICAALRMWLECDDVSNTPKAKKLLEILRKEDTKTGQIEKALKADIQHRAVFEGGDDKIKTLEQEA